MSKFGKELIESMADGLDYLKTRNPHGRRVHIVQVPDVKAIRERLKMSQSEFSAAYRIPISTLRGWEQGVRKPDAPAAAYLQVIAREPRVALAALKLG